jgi:hypothetical protein
MNYIEHRDVSSTFADYRATLGRVEAHCEQSKY